MSKSGVNCGLRLHYRQHHSLQSYPNLLKVMNMGVPIETRCKLDEVTVNPLRRTLVESSSFPFPFPLSSCGAVKPSVKSKLFKTIGGWIVPNTFLCRLGKIKCSIYSYWSNRWYLVRGTRLCCRYFCAVHQP